jgi:hypothetical protein
MSQWMVGGPLGVNGHPALCRVGMVTSGDIGRALTQHLSTTGYLVREQICRY